MMESSLTRGSERTTSSSETVTTTASRNGSVDPPEGAGVAVDSADGVAVDLQRAERPSTRRAAKSVPGSASTRARVSWVMRKVSPSCSPRSGRRASAARQLGGSVCSSRAPRSTQVGFASSSARSRRPWCGPRVRASRQRWYALVAPGCQGASATRAAVGRRRVPTHAPGAAGRISSPRRTRPRSSLRCSRIPESPERAVP